MAMTPSNMVPLGTPMPHFRLRSTSGNDVSDKDFAGKKVLVVMFICNHCPFVQHLRGALAKFGLDYEDSDVGIVAINSNYAGTHPADSFEKMVEEAASAGYVFPYLHDESQAVAKAFNAACTPDFFVYDSRRRLYYRGQFDDSRPGNGVAVTGADLRRAVDDASVGIEPFSSQLPSVGCNIKWKPGNEPLLSSVEP